MVMDYRDEMKELKEKEKEIYNNLISVRNRIYQIQNACTHPLDYHQTSQGPEAGIEDTYCTNCGKLLY